MCFLNIMFFKFEVQEKILYFSDSKMPGASILEKVKMLCDMNAIYPLNILRTVRSDLFASCVLSTPLKMP